MLSPHARQVAYGLALLDAVGLGLAFTVAFAVRVLHPLPLVSAPDLPVLSEHMWMPILAAPLFWVLASQAGLYRPLSGPLQLLAAGLRAVTLLGLFLGTAVFAFQAKTYSRTVFFLFLALVLGWVLALRFAVRLRTALAGPDCRAMRRLLIVGVNPDAREVARRLTADTTSTLRLIGHVRGFDERDEDAAGATVLGQIDELKRIVEEEVVDEVVFALPPAQLLRCDRQIGWCEELGKTVHVKVDFIRTLFAKTYVAQWEGTPILTVSPTPQDAVALLTKRVIDLGVASLGLLVLSPVLLACAAAIKLSSPGTVLFRQRRVGLNGRIFDLYKFRSMRRDAEQQRDTLAGLNEATGPVFKMRHDPRVTGVGRWLRRFSLDEVPQLWNVLRGDMSLVGPRPPVPTEVVQYERWQRRRLSMKPGLTCLWQVSGRAEVPFEEWMKLDLAYIDNWSLKLDLVILLKTVPAVLLARGAH